MTHSLAAQRKPTQSAPIKAPSKKPARQAVLDPSKMSTWAKTLPIQASLKVNTPGDKYEQEADRLANQVMRMGNPAVQRKTCACGKPIGPDGMCEDCKRKQQQKIQRMSTGDVAQTAAPPAVHQALQQQGRPLDNATRNFMESRFGQPFKQVRVHTSETAAKSAESINANAFTYGPDIFFNQGQYQPQTAAGRSLLAHELVHVIQQSGQFQPTPTVQRQSKTLAYLELRPCDTNPLIPCPPPPAPSPITSCGNRTHESVMTDVARHYVQSEIDSSASTGVRHINCFIGIGPCDIEFDSGIAVHVSLLIDPFAQPGVGGGFVFVDEIMSPSSNRKLSSPLGPRCSYYVNCPNPYSLTITHRGCHPQKGQPFIDPGEFKTLPDDERLA